MLKIVDLQEKSGFKSIDTADSMDYTVYNKIN